MEQIDKYIKRNKHESIWDLGLYNLLTVGSTSPSGIISLLTGILRCLFFNTHVIFSFFFWGGGVRVDGREGLYCFGVCLFLFLLPGQ